MDLIDQAAMPAPGDPWSEARKAAAPNAIVFKHIDRIKGEEAFYELERNKKNLAAGLDLYDGATVTYFTPQPFVSESAIKLATDHAGAST